MARSTKDPGLNRRLRITYVVLAAWFVILAGVLSVLEQSVAAGGLGLGLFGLGFAGAVLLMGPELIPSGGLEPAVRRLIRMSTSISAVLVISTMVLVGVHAAAVLILGIGIVAALASMGVALWAAVR